MMKIPENTDFNLIKVLENVTKLKDDSFPLYGLPLGIQKFVEECHIVYGSPHEFFAMSFIVAIGAALRKQVCLYNGKYRNYPQLWVMLVAPTGVGKSEPLNLAFRPLEKQDELSYQSYNKAYQQWVIDCSSAKKAKKEEPQKPKFKQMLVNDATPEALYESLASNLALTHYCDELSGWFADIGRYSSSGEVSRSLSMFDNKMLTIIRKSQEPLLIPEPFYSIIGTIQPQVLQGIINKNNMDCNGMIQRFIFIYPNNVEKPPYSEAVVSEEQLNKYNDIIVKCCNITQGGTIIYKLSQESKRLYIDFVNNELRSVINNLPISDDYTRSMLSKFEIHCLRLALIIEVIKMNSDFHNPTIDKLSMQYAIDLSRYFIKCSEKVKQLLFAISGYNNALQLTSEELIRELNNKYPIKNKNALAIALGVSRPFISKILNQKQN